MVETSELTEFGADAVSRLLAAHGVERAPCGAALIGTADPPRIMWANQAAVDLFGSDVAEVLEGRLFGGQGRQGLAAAIERLIVDGGARQERLRLVRGFATRTVPVVISRWSGDSQDLLVLTSTSGDGSNDVDNALRTPSPAAPAEPPAPPTAAVPARSAPPVEAPTPVATASVGAPEDAADALKALGAKRFLWQSDAAGRLVGIDDGVSALRHLTNGSLLGRNFAEALEAAGIVGADRLAGFLLGQRSFSNVRLVWPTEVSGWATAVLLGAVPVRGAAGAFMGFRGFGVMDFAKLIPHALPEEQLPPSPDPVDELVDTDLPEDNEPVDDWIYAEPGDSVDAGPDPTVTVAPAEPAVVPQPEASVEPPRPAPVDVRVTFPSANIVPLRPSRLRVRVSPTPATAPAEPSLETALSPTEEVLNLSSAEQNNFDAIARALRTASAAASQPALLAPGDATAMVERLPVAIAIEARGAVAFANAAFLALTGYESVTRLDEAGGWPHLLGGLELSQVAGPDQDGGFPVIGASGGVVPVEGRRVAVEWRGEPAEMLALRPAPDRMAQVQALEIEARRRTDEGNEARALLDRVEDAVAVLDARGRVLSLNAAARSLFGRPDDDAIGESIGAFLSPDGQSAVLGAVFAAGSAGPQADEVALLAAARRRPGAAPYDVRVRALGAGRVGLVIRDRTADMVIREDARHLRDELDNAAQTRADFLAKVSHEMRTPLNTVIGFSELMLEERFGPVGSPRYRDYLTDIHEAGKHAVGLLGGLVDLSSVAGGGQAMTPAATDINAVVGDSVAELQGQAHRDRVIVRQSLAGNLPRALVDAEAMRQVMDNILSNAIQFNEPGGQVIVSTALHESGAVVIRVRDTGIGMSDAEIAIAMEPFRQLGASKPGSGLGLPRARALAEANHGTLSIRSRKSEGTLVEVSLRPAPDAKEDAPAA